LHWINMFAIDDFGIRIFFLWLCQAACC